MQEMWSIPGLGRSPGGGNGPILQYSCLGDPMDRGAWQAIVHSATESDMTWQLSTRATHILESFFAGVGVNLLSINYRIEQRNNNID